MKFVRDFWTLDLSVSICRSEWSGSAKHLRCTPPLPSPPYRPALFGASPVGFSGGQLTLHPIPRRRPRRVATLSHTCSAVLRSLMAVLPPGDLPPAMQPATHWVPGLPPRTAGGWSGCPGGATDWWRLVASADGICGLITAGYLSNSDSRESRRCGCRPLGDVPRRWSSSWCPYVAARSSPSGGAGACGGPGVGENSGGNRDGLEGLVRCAGRVLAGRVPRRPFLYTFCPPAILALAGPAGTSRIAFSRPGVSRRRVVSG